MQPHPQVRGNVRLRLFSKSKHTLSANHKVPSNNTHRCEVQLSGFSCCHGQESTRAQLAAATPGPLLGSVTFLWRGSLSSTEAQMQGEEQRGPSPHGRQRDGSSEGLLVSSHAFHTTNKTRKPPISTDRRRNFQNMELQGGCGVQPGTGRQWRAGQ